MGNSNQEFSVAIIGAGFAGICTALRLKRAGFDNFAIFESSNELGGTWRDNTYPGCACDVPSHLYSFSFEPSADWPEVYSGYEDIHNYLKNVSDKHNLRPYIRFNKRVEELRFDENRVLWTLTTSDGETYTANVIISGTGPLNKPAIPELPGIEKFRGKKFHSSHWDHQFKLEGQRIAAIGTGASAVQYVPAIAPKVSELYVFQRTPTWVVPRMNRRYTQIEKALLKWVPGLRWIYRNVQYWYREYMGLGFTGSERMNRGFEKLARWHLKRQVNDEATREKLTPSYQIGCKRVNVSDAYLPAFNRDNVELVVESISAVTENGVVTSDGKEREVDAIIYGTGFITTEFLQPMKVYGVGGAEISDSWNGRFATYLGISVSGFPNYFLLLGPNTGLGHNSVVFMIEAQVNYVLQAIEQLRQGQLDGFDVKREVQEDFQTWAHERLAQMTWSSGCKSWYLTAEGENYAIWPGLTVSYWRRTRQFDPSVYTALIATEISSDDEQLAA
ncbi:MAG: NAD(P)/FAD-dependent oxidoreductase [Pseudomonadota bacterium]